MADFCLSCCKEKHSELRSVSDRRIVVSKYTLQCSGCGQQRNIALGIRPKKKLNLDFVVRHP